MIWYVSGDDIGYIYGGDAERIHTMRGTPITFLPNGMAYATIDGGWIRAHCLKGQWGKDKWGVHPKGVAVVNL